MKVALPLAATLMLVVPLATFVAPVPVHAQPSESCGASGLCWPRLRRGVHGYQTKTLQYLLAARGMKVKADGIFGTTTVAALRSYQKKRGLKVDGIAGWQTWEALCPKLQRGSRGPAVVALQTLLNGKDYALRNDGIYGATTEKAVSGFQQENTIDKYQGKVNADVWCLLVDGHFQGEGD